MKAIHIKLIYHNITMTEQKAKSDTTSMSHDQKKDTLPSTYYMTYFFLPLEDKNATPLEKAFGELEKFDIYIEDDKNLRKKLDEEYATHCKKYDDLLKKDTEDKNIAYVEFMKEVDKFNKEHPDTPLDTSLPYDLIYDMYMLYKNQEILKKKISEKKNKDGVKEKNSNEESIESTSNKENSTVSLDEKVEEKNSSDETNTENSTQESSSGWWPFVSSK